LGADGFPPSKESKGAAELLDAFEHGDQAKLDRVVKTQIFNIIDNQVAILARSLKITDATAVVNTSPEELKLDENDISADLKGPLIVDLGKGKEKVPDDADEELIKQRQKLFASPVKAKKQEQNIPPEEEHKEAHKEAPSEVLPEEEHKEAHKEALSEVPPEEEHKEGTEVKEKYADEDLSNLL